MSDITRRKFLETGLKFLGCAGVTALMPTRVLDTLSKKEVEKQECLLPDSVEYLGKKFESGQYVGDASLAHHFDGRKWEAIKISRIIEEDMRKSMGEGASRAYCHNRINHTDPKRRCRE